jgi:glutaredoxin-dependent peroxiredoxin
MALAIGDRAPAFSLVDTDKKPRNLSEFLGKKTVLAFFPGAFTGTCTKEMCTLRDSLESLQSMNAHLVAISVDAPASNKAFAAKHNLDFPILSDYARNVSENYSGLYNDFSGLKGYTASKRAVFVLDSQARVTYAWISDNPGVEPNYEEVRKAVAST